MPKSNPRVGRGHGSKISRQVAAAGAETAAATAKPMTQEDIFSRLGVKTGPVEASGKRETPTSKPIKFSKPAMNWRRAGKFAAAGGVATGGAAYLYHQRQKDKTVAKYYDPFSGDTVEFGKTDRSSLPITKADGNGTKLVHVRRTGRQLSNTRTLTHVRKGFASQAFVNQPVSTRMVSTGHNVNAAQRSAQNLQIFRGKNTTIKTKSPLKLVRR